MNGDARHSQMKHWPCLGDAIIFRCNFYRLQTKKHLKIDEKLKLTFANIPLLNNLQYEHCLYIYMSELKSMTCTPNSYKFAGQEKDKNVC